MANYKEVIDYCYAFNTKGTVSPQKFDLSSINVDIFKLSKEEARGLAVGLSHIQIQGRGLLIIPAHCKYWSSIGKHLIAPPSLYLGETQSDLGMKHPLEEHIRNLFVTVVKYSTSEWKTKLVDSLIDWTWPDNYIQTATYGINPAEYLVYPLLDATLKKKLYNFMNLNGKITKEITALNIDGTKKRTYKEGQTISSIYDLFLILIKECDGDELIQDLNEIFKDIESAYKVDSAIKVISSDWRNSSLHGDRHIASACYTVLNIILLIAISSFNDDEWNNHYNDFDF